MAAASEPQVVGRVGAAHGVRGWLRLVSFLDPPEAIAECGALWLSGPAGWQPLRLVQLRQQGRGLVMQLAEVQDRTAAEALTGRSVGALRDDLPPAEEGEYYWSDLIGCRVETLQGDDLGEVTGLLETGANDVMQVAGERPRLVPFAVPQVVREVDLEQRVIRVDWHPDD